MLVNSRLSIESGPAALPVLRVFNMSSTSRDVIEIESSL